MVDCIVSDIEYGLDPAIALVTFKERVGKFMFVCIRSKYLQVSWLLQAIVIICFSQRQRNIGIIQFRKKVCLFIKCLAVLRCR